MQKNFFFTIIVLSALIVCGILLVQAEKTLLAQNTKLTKAILDETKQVKSIDNGKPAVNCVVGGCSGEICAKQQMISDCQYLPGFACLKYSRCEVQSDGQCGWTQKPEYLECLKNL